MIVHKLPKIALIALSLGIVTFSQPLVSDAKSEAKKASKASSEAKAASPAQSGSDEDAVRAQLARLSKAIADGDARELATLWTQDGNYIDSDGAMSKGRAAVEARFSKVMASEGRQMVELLPESVKVLSPTVVSVDGVVRRKNGSDGPTPETRFSLVFLKQDSNWLITSACETPLSPQADADPLKDLSWLIGEWSAENNGAYVKMKADWAANKNFITCQYESRKAKDAPQLESRQVIGWDPRTNEPISWHFDSSGGFGFGNWVKKDRQWLVEATGVERDGSTTTATNVLSPADKDNFVFQSVNRSINGVAFNDTNPLKVRRVIK